MMKGTFSAESPSFMGKSMVSFPAKISQQSQFIESCKTGFRTSLMQQIMSKLGWIVVVAFEVLGGLAVDDCERRRSLKEQHPLVVPLQTGVDRTTKPRPTGNPPETPRRVSQRKWCMDHVTPRLPQWMCASQLQQFSLLHFHEPFPPRDYRLITNLPWHFSSIEHCAKVNCRGFETSCCQWQLGSKSGSKAQIPGIPMVSQNLAPNRGMNHPCLDLDVMYIILSQCYECWQPTTPSLFCFFSPFFFPDKT